MLPEISSALDELQDYVSNPQARAVAVSGWSVGQQIEHALLTIRGVVGELSKGKARFEPAKPTLRGRLVLMVGRIPRGKGEAPLTVLPRSAPQPAELNALMAKSREALVHLAGIDDTSTFFHPIFGRLDKAQSIRFLWIHTNHHLRIIRDIIAT